MTTDRTELITQLRALSRHEHSDASIGNDAADELERTGCARGQRTTQWCAEAADARAQVDALRAEVEGLREDATRYRWLRSNPTFMGWEHDFRPDEIDTAVNAARESGNEEKANALKAVAFGNF